MKKNLSEKTRVCMLKLIVAACLFLVGTFLLIVSNADVAVNTLGLLSYISGCGLFFAISGKRKAINEYRKFIKS